MRLTNRTQVMFGVAACAALARLPGVYDRPFWEDEVASARLLSEPSLGALIHRVAHTESTPPLWYSLAWVVHLAGAPLREERLLSVLFGALLAAGTVALAHRFVSLPLAGTAGLLIALGGGFVTHGHELRAYELFALLSLLFGLCLVRALEVRSRSRDLALAASVALGGSTHYFFAILGARCARLALARPSCARDARTTLALDRCRRRDRRAVGAADAGPVPAQPLLVDRAVPDFAPSSWSRCGCSPGRGTTPRSAPCCRRRRSCW